MNSDSKIKEVLFDLTNDELYVANGGRPFNRQGVIGICASHLGEKRPTDSDSDDYQAENTALISEIRKREIRTYKNDKNRLTSDSNAEREIGHDYGGRFVWELLQNADDVMGDETQELLKCEGIHENPPRLTFRIPHPCQPNKTEREFLEAGYSTVIRLPFRDEEAREKAKNILETLKPYFLLLSQELESIRIILDGEAKCFSVERKTQGFSDGRIVLHSPEGTTIWQRWAATKDSDNAKRLTVAIVLPLDEKRKAVAVPHADEMPFYVFFPTEEQIGVQALLHASFDLEQNRKHLRKGSYDSELLTLFSQVLERVILDIPFRTALETFGSIPPWSKPKKIEDIIREKMRTTPFVPIIGGGKVPPSESTFWKDGLGEVLRTDEPEVKEAALIRLNTSLLSDSDFLDVLEELGAENIDDSEYIRLLQYCRNKSLKDCIASFWVLVEGGLKRASNEQTPTLLRKVPCWWTESERARSLDVRSPLLWEKPKNWPDWLPADSLHPKFRTKIRKEEEGEGEEWKKLTNDSLLRKEEDYIDRALIPCVKEWEQRNWKQRGFQVLKTFSLWESQRGFDRAEPWIRGEEDRRNRLSAALHLPTDKGWLPAIDCFAGKDWDGPEAFDEFFKEREEFGIVQPFEEWPKYLQKTDKDKWKGLLRWIGVSWEPKVCQTHKSQGGERIKDYEIQDFPDCIAKVKTREVMHDIFPKLLKLASKDAQTCWKPKKNSRKVHSRCESSSAFKQLREEAWLPVKKSLLESRLRIPPSEAFFPNTELSGLLPEVDRSGIDDNAWQDIESKLRELDVMDEPDDPQKWHEWMRKLAQKGTKMSEEERKVPSDWMDSAAKDLDLWRAARSLYRKYLQWPPPLFSDDFPSDIKIPCVRLKNDRRVLTFAQPGKVHWIDEPYLADLTADLTLEKELLARGYKLFIFRLQEAKKPEQLGVQKLSDSIKCRPCFSPSNNAETEKLAQRYKKRRIVLEKVLKIELPETVALKAVKNLVLELSANGQSLECRPVHSWKEEGTNSVLVDIEKDKWRSLADALARRLDKKYPEQRAIAFEVYLAAEDDSVLERARDAGVPAEALEEVKGSLGPNEQAGETGEGDEEREEANSEGHTGRSTSNFGPHSQSSKTRNGRRGEARDRHQRLKRENQTGELHPESGREAERWLEERLCEVWPDVKNVRTGRDFTLSVGGQTVHIEAKHVENRPGSIHWSGRQYKLAEQTQTNGEKDSYFIAVLSPDAEHQYAIHWIWDPLEELKGLKRNVTWSGKSEPQGLRNGNWNVDETRPAYVLPKSFDIEIKLTDAIFDEENQDSPQLEKLRARIENPQNSAHEASNAP